MPALLFLQLVCCVCFFSSISVDAFRLSSSISRYSSSYRLSDETTNPLKKARNTFSAIPAGWKGGFAESNPAYAYPKPDLSDLPLLDNLANIPLLTRQQRIQWPQFSWLSVEGNEDSRVYEMFAPNISRLGYTDEGRVYSIICPQLGIGTDLFGEMNIEVTVTGNRGWVNEPGKDLFAELGVEPKIWFSPSNNKKSKMLMLLEKVLRRHDFPFSKDKAILVSTNLPGDPKNPILKMIRGTNPEFPIPSFGRHDVDAYNVGHISVQIRKIHTTGVEKIDAFNKLVVDIFNLGSGNMLNEGSILSWNLWFEEPELVNKVEWANHADYWRQSLMVNHTSPDGIEGSDRTYFDGTLFEPCQKEREIELIMNFIEKHADQYNYIGEFRDLLNEEGIKTPILDKLIDIKGSDKLVDHVDTSDTSFKEIFKRY